MKRLLYLLVLLPIGVLLYSCGSADRGVAPPGEGTGQTASKAVADFEVVTVFFGTDRNDQGGSMPAERFGNDRGELRLGTVAVSIPNDHQPGELESPSLLRLEFSEDPSEHVVLMRVDVTDPAQFYAALRNRLAAFPAGSMLVFVHGYNVSFEDAARRTAQMSYDLTFEGAPVFFSWPSKSDIALYSHDASNVEWAEGHLKTFLVDLLEQGGAQRLYLVAHSMGNRALTRVLPQVVAAFPEARQRIAEIILAAPDVDADTFKDILAPALVEIGAPITLYANANDKALQASMTFNGYPRAGDSGAGVVLVQGIETVDATALETEFLNHSYYATPTVIKDIEELFKYGRRPNERAFLAPVEDEGGTYWRFNDKGQDP